MNGPDWKPAPRPKKVPRQLRAKPGYRMPARSKETARQAPERQRFVRMILDSRPVCQAQVDGCYGRSSDVHEPLTRARGGSITDPDNALALCRFCHDWIHDHPRAAAEKGWLRSA